NIQSYYHVLYQHIQSSYLIHYLSLTLIVFASFVRLSHHLTLLVHLNDLALDLELSLFLYSYFSVSLCNVLLKNIEHYSIVSTAMTFALWLILSNIVLSTWLSVMM